MKSANKVVILLCLLMPATTFALEVGNARVHSELYQTLNADVPLTNMTGIAVKELRISHAPASAYFLRGVAMDPNTNQLDFSIANVDGRAVIKITSPEPVTEPVMDFLVQLQWPQGELIKKITLLPQLPGQGDVMPTVAVSNYKKIDFTKDMDTLKDKAETVWQQTLNKIISFTKDDHI